MAAASGLVDGAATRRVGGARTLAAVAAARGSVETGWQDRAAARERDRQARRLSEEERAELSYFWDDYEAAIGYRSAHGAVEDLLLRAPPRERAAERAVLSELSARRDAPRDKLVELARLEHGVTRYEVSRALSQLARAGYVEPFVAPAAAGCVEERVRLVSLPRWAPAPPLTREERWRRDDEALEVACRGGPVPRRQPGGAPGRADLTGRVSRASVLADAVGRALASLGPLERRVLERSYGSRRRSRGEREHDFGADLARLVPLTDACERARAALAARICAESRLRLGAALGETRVSSLLLDPEADADRRASAEQALSEVLDRCPSSAQERARWRVEREAFVRRARAQAEQLLGRACAAYRAARRGYSS